jgi:ATP-binding cassette, subfamily B, bacterial PglK
VVNKILKILDYTHLKYFLILFSLYIPVTILETIGISSLPVFVIFITQPENFNEYFSNFGIIKIVKDLTIYERTIYGSIVIGLIFLIKGLVTLLLGYFEVYLNKITVRDISSKLYKKYLGNEYYFHVENEPPKLIQNINDVNRVTAIIFSLLTLLKESFLIITVVAILFFADPRTFSIVFTLLSLPLLIYYMLLRNVLKNQGNVAKKYRDISLREMTQGFAGIKIVKLLNKEGFLAQSFISNLSKALHYDMFVRFLSKIPRVFLEILSVGTILILMIIFVRNGKSFNEFLPLLTFVVVATVRLIPSFGNIVVSLNLIRFHSVTLDNIYNSLKYKSYIKKVKKIQKSKKKNVKINKNFLKMESVNYRYPNKKENIIQNLSLIIDKGSITGLTGSSGSGKTTLVDIILGLLKPKNGKIINDGKNIEDDLKSWSKSIGYVPQSVNLINDTIKRNICYGHSDIAIDIKLLNLCIKFSELDNFINSLPKKLNTNIGHLGKKISGGQLQRIGIARALYQNPELLILDEATNALDIKTETKLIKNIRKFKSKLTVILVSHRLSVLKNCNRICIIENGNIKFKGSFKNFSKNKFLPK